MDASDEASLSEAFQALDEQWGGLDGFVNLAGVMIGMRPLAETTADNLRHDGAGEPACGVPGRQCRDAAADKGSAPSLVNIASGLAHFIRPHYGAYAASKAGMIALTKTLALEHAPHVRANVVAPGAVDTAFLRGGTGRSGEDAASTIDTTAYGAMVPLKRIAEPDDIVGPILFLLGSASRYMTGQTLWVNGGAYMP